VYTVTLVSAAEGLHRYIPGAGSQKGYEAKTIRRRVGLRRTIADGDRVDQGEHMALKAARRDQARLARPLFCGPGSNGDVRETSVYWSARFGGQDSSGGTKADC